MAAIATPQFGRSRVLVASADSSFRKQLLTDLDDAALCSEEAVGGAHALAKLVQFPCDSVLLDRNLPDLDSREVAELIRKRYPATEVEFVDSRLANQAPQDAQIREIAPEESKAARREGKELPLRGAGGNAAVAEIGVSEPLPGMIGRSRAMQKAYGLARMVAPRDTTVLISGETGTGKELVAQALHQLSTRARSPFVVVNCAAIPEALLEAELFGHARGAFTGAVQSRLGRIHVAQGGTLFLDEIGDLPLSMQAKMLRFLQNGEVQRLGCSDVYRVDVRVICATNVRLLDLVHTRQFRQDLYYRLAIFPIALPALRERAEDVAELAGCFLGRLCEENSVPLKWLNPEALGLLQSGPWPGNVRELQHAVERAFILSGNETEIGAELFQSFGEGN